MELLIVGVGYVGLVTAACFAERGHHVLCLDIDQEKIANLQNGKVPFFEPGLEDLVKKNQSVQALQFTTDYSSAVKQSRICFIAVPTPSRTDGACDLRYVMNAVGKIAELMDDHFTFVMKSTVPPGTSQHVRDHIAAILAKRGVNIAFDVVSNPEFLKEGSAVTDCLNPDRIILGVDNKNTETLMREIYAAFNVDRNRIFIMDPVSSELTKYAANAMLATRISFMNEIAQLCEKIGADVQQVRIGIGSDGRIGPQFLNPGPGYGGSCFPKDLQALISLAETHDHPCHILRAVETVNKYQKQFLAKKIQEHFVSQDGASNKIIAIWGLSFKPDTDDIRESPSLELIRELLHASAKLRLFDPAAMAQAQKIFGSHPSITWCEDEYEAARDADAVVLVTEWKRFRSVDFSRILSLVKQPIFFDGRNQFRPTDLASFGFHYYGIGVPQSSPGLYVQDISKIGIS